MFVLSVFLSLEKVIGRIGMLSADQGLGQVSSNWTGEFSVINFCLQRSSNWFLSSFAPDDFFLSGRYDAINAA
jgi:hypothetical protein